VLKAEPEALQLTTSPLGERGIHDDEGGLHALIEQCIEGFGVVGGGGWQSGFLRESGAILVNLVEVHLTHLRGDERR
jgi:hypothetical protein